MFLQFVKQTAVPANLKFSSSDTVLDGVPLKAQDLGPVGPGGQLLWVKLLKILPDGQALPGGSCLRFSCSKRSRIVHSVILVSSICRM